MPREIRMPMWGMGMLEGTVVEWYKQEGDEVDQGEPLAEIEAAKTVEDLLAPEAGVLQRIVVPEGETVPVQEVLAVLATAADAAGGDGPAGSGSQDIQDPPAGSTRQGVPAASGPVGARDGDGAPAGAAGSRDAGGSAGARAAASPAVGSGPVRNVVPRARQRAKELGVGLTAVTGSGPGGRITVQDVERTAAGARSGARARAEAGPPTGAAAPGAGAPGAGAPAGHGAAAPAADDGRTVPLRGMRGTIAQRMVASLQSSAQLTLVTTADVTALVAHRDTWDGDPRPTYTDYVVKAVALALREHPRLNATVEADVIRLLDHVHVGVATALDDGLVVTVLRDADTTPLAQLARTAAELVGRVRSGSYGVADVTGSTFTVSSLGGQGIDAFTPIINPPEAAILGVGRVVDEPVRDGDGLAWRKAVTLSLTIDHRVVDGAPGAAFLRTVGELLGRPDDLAR